MQRWRNAPLYHINEIWGEDLLGMNEHALPMNYAFG